MYDLYGPSFQRYVSIKRYDYFSVVVYVPWSGAL